MGFSLEVVGASKKNIIGRIHIKYVDNMDLKIETDGMDRKIAKSQVVLKNDTENKLWM